MIIKCINCGVSLPVPNASFKNGPFTITCPQCKTSFKPGVNTGGVVFQTGAQPVNQPQMVNQQMQNPKPMVQAPVQQAMARQSAPQQQTADATQIMTPTAMPNAANDAAGWLVVHDENAPLQTINLIPGREYLVGRKSTTRPCDIMIDTRDEYMSRNHFWINVRRFSNGLTSFVLYDNHSTNTTFINGKKMADQSKYLLQDNDLIQAGHTKIVFRIKTNRVNDAADATHIVSSQKHAETVLIKK